MTTMTVFLCFCALKVIPLGTYFQYTTLRAKRFLHIVSGDVLADGKV